MPETNTSTADEIKALGKLVTVESYNGEYPAAGKQFDINGVPHILKPDNCNLENLEHALAAPTRIRTHIIVRTLGSFLAYLADYVQPGTAIFASSDSNGLRAAAIIDYPEKSTAPAWGSHRIDFVTEHTKEWQRWREYSGKNFNQMAFVEFVENNLPHFITPSGADMLTLARDIELRQSVEWKGSVRTETGDTRLDYANTTKTGGAGEVEIPAKFTIGVRPFRGNDPYKIEARLRPRLDGNTLLIKYELLLVEELLEKAMTDLVDAIATATNITPLIGAAPTLG